MIRDCRTSSAGALSAVYMIALLIPIRIYNIVQPMGKTMVGGANGGRFILEYKFIFPAVANAEMPPTVRAIKQDTI